jgi:transposase
MALRTPNLSASKWVLVHFRCRAVRAGWYLGGVSQLTDIIRSSLPNPDALELAGIDESEDGRVLRVRSQESPRCPSCSGSEVTYHSTYTRRLRDLPWQGRPVRIQLQVRRFRCRNRQCPRQIFAESPAGVGARKARATTRLAQTVRAIAYVLGGRPASRLLERLGIKASRQTILRHLQRRCGPPNQLHVRVLGVDDWAWRKHQKYGTMLMDLEQRRVVDLLPVRSASSLADWLREHPGVEIIARDRCGLYAEGGREGAPWAVQVTDRYHLMSNLSEAVEQTLQELQIKARAALEQFLKPKRSKRLTLVEARYQRCRQARYERYQAVIELSNQGYTQLEIAERVGIGAGTVARWQNAGGFPERRIRRDRRRDQARLVQDRGRGLRPALARTHFSSARMAALLLTPPRDLSETQRSYRDSFLRFCPKAYKVRKLALQFRAMLRWRRSVRLGEWIGAAMNSGFPLIAQFGRTLRRDLRAVELAMTAPWSNGPLEGQINRLKMIKRQMYGRAGFELLKARVLPLSA